MPKAYANYHVSLKILLRKGDEFLFLRNPHNTQFDLPGGRIDDNEDAAPLNEILAREIREELGENLKYQLGNPAFQFRWFITEKGWQIFLTVYEAEYLSGEIQISDEHSDYIWINPKKYYFKKEEFTNQEEYLAFMDYFGKL